MFSAMWEENMQIQWIGLIPIALFITENPLKYWDDVPWTYFQCTTKPFQIDGKSVWNRSRIHVLTLL